MRSFIIFAMCLMINTGLLAKTTSTAKVNINTATAAELHHVVKGLGKRRIHNLIQYRKEHGKFNSLSDLVKVKGISKRFMRRHHEQIEQRLTVANS